ncbi:hypothetical protein RSAG8_10489, partial [Rhizoctonia solani AG-8 WAC10335]
MGELKEGTIQGKAAERGAQQAYNVLPDILGPFTHA